jgi:hypothetical protein
MKSSAWSRSVRRVGGFQLIRGSRAHAASRWLVVAILVLLALITFSPPSRGSQPRSSFVLSTVINDQDPVHISFILTNQGPSYYNITADWMNLTATVGPELRLLSGNEGSNVWTAPPRRWVNASATFDLFANVTSEVQARLAANPSVPIFSTVNVTVVYTDQYGYFPRTIYRSVTFALNYHAPPESISLVPAAIAGLGGAGAVGIFVLVARRARLEELYLLHDSGMLIRHWARGGDDGRDSDIMSGMLVVLQEFVKDSWRADEYGGESLEELRFGTKRVLLARGDHAIIAAVVQGRYLNGLTRKLRQSVLDFERSHEDVLGNWNGNVDVFSKADAIGRRFLGSRARLA